MKCQRCESSRILEASAKCSDLFSCSLTDNEYNGYVLGDLGIGGGAYVSFKLCLDCGQLQGHFPKSQSEMERQCSVQEIEEFYDNHFSEGQVLFSNWQIASRLQDAAEKLSFKFAKFNDEFMHSNIGKQVPNKITYVNMYLNNDAEIE